MNDGLAHNLKEEILNWFSAGHQFSENHTVGFRSCFAMATAKNEREENQDRAVFVEYSSEEPRTSFRLYAVFDGMGGMLDGGKCAEYATASLIAKLVSIPRNKSRIALIEALTATNHDLSSLYSGNGGTTFAGIYTENDRAHAINVGDSRIYKVSSAKRLSKLSVDHRLGDQFSKIKGLEGIALNPEIARRLGQYVGMTSEIRPSVRIIDQTSIHPDEGFLLATDGAFDIGDDQITKALLSHNEIAHGLKEIIHHSSQLPDSDNATAIYLSSTELTRAPQPPLEKHQSKLQIWSPYGAFNFIVTTPTHPTSTTNTSKTNAPKKKKRVKVKGDVRKTQNPLLFSKESQRVHQDRLVKPEITIQQLTFEPLSENESPK